MEPPVLVAWAVPLEGRVELPVLVAQARVEWVIKVVPVEMPHSRSTLVQISLKGSKRPARPAPMPARRLRDPDAALSQR